MRTNIDIDDKLIREAMDLTKTKTKTKKETVELALKELVAHSKRKKLLEYKGKLHWEGNLDEMREV